MSELYHTSPPHLLMNIFQLEVSCLTQHFSAICGSDCEICLLDWAVTHLTPKIKFDQNHHLKWSISHIASKRSKIKRRQISSSRVNRTTPHSRLSIFLCSESALLRVISSSSHSSATFLNTRRKCSNAY